MRYAQNRFALLSMADIVVPNPIAPLYNSAWLYVPRSNIVLPVNGTPPVSNYILLETGTDILATESLDLFITET